MTVLQPPHSANLTPHPAPVAPLMEQSGREGNMRWGVSKTNVVYELDLIKLTAHICYINSKQEKSK